MVALDAKTGDVVWEKRVEDYKLGYYMTLAPLVAKGNVMVGGLRGASSGFEVSFKRSTRSPDEIRWKTFTVPGPGRAGTRDLDRKRMADRWRAGLDNRQLRPFPRALLLGCR